MSYITLYVKYSPVEELLFKLARHTLAHTRSKTNNWYQTPPPLGGRAEVTAGQYDQSTLRQSQMETIR
jgi:hypothetical protein